MNVFISNVSSLTVPEQYAHLVRSWDDVCHLDRLSWITYSRVYQGKGRCRHYKLTRMIKCRSGVFARTETRYATLDNAVRAALKKVSA